MKRAVRAPDHRRHWTLAALALCCVPLLISGCSTSSTAVAPVTRTGNTTAPARATLSLPAGVSSLRVYVEPDDGKRVISTAILHARHSILLEMYLLTDRVLLHDLERAAAKGVDVRVILERKPYGGGANPNTYAYNNLMAANIPTHWSSPAFALTHAKTMVVDGDAAYIMTPNYSHAAFSTNREFIAVDGVAADVSQVEAIFEADWATRPIEPTNAEIPISPSDSRTLLDALITSAHHTLDLYEEEFQDKATARLLATQAQQGVRVRLILPYETAKGAKPDAKDVALLVQAGGQVRRMATSRALYIHAKVVIADGREAFLGSENLSAASLDRNREVGVFIADDAAINRLQTTFAHDWGVAKKAKVARSASAG